VAGALLAAGLAFGLAASSGGHDEEAKIEQMLAALQGAYFSQRYDIACSHLTHRTQREVGSFGHSAPTSCEKDMARRMSARILSPRDLVAPEVERLTVKDDRATGDLRLGGLAPVGMSFERESGKWKLAKLFGTVPQHLPLQQALAATTPDSAPATVEPVTVGGAAKSCPEVRVRSITAQGGCVLEAEGTFQFTVLHAFGDRLYASCDLNLLLQIDGQGKFIVTSVGSARGVEPAGDTCGDIYMCGNGDGESALWRGRVVSTRGGMRARVVNACFDTCLGRFAGPVSAPLSSLSGEKIRLKLRLAALGTSGLALSGHWDLKRGGRDPSIAIRVGNRIQER